MLRIAGIKIV